MRSHCFLLHGKSWKQSSAYDLNPSVDKTGLGLNIDMDGNDLDLDLAKSVGEYFQLSLTEMNAIIEEVKAGTANWRTLATELNISRQEQEQMARAFTMDNARSKYRGMNR